MDPAVRVESGPTGSRVVAGAALPAGAIVLRLEGDLVDRPSRHSLQRADGLHLVARPGEAPPWICVNHSCDPNLIVEADAMVARRPIAAGEELTFDYETTEAELAEPFDCGCGAAGCRGRIRGRRHAAARRDAPS